MPTSCRPLLLLALSVVSLLSTTAVRADEAYVCDGGTVVYVAPGELEAMKRTNACVAAYYGLTIEEAAPVPANGTAAQLQTGAPRLKPALDAVRTIPVDTVRKPSPPPQAAPDTDFRNVHVINATGDEKSFFHGR